MVEIEKEQFSNWLDNEVTKKFFDLIDERMQSKSEHLVSGGTLGDLAAERTSNVVGYIAALSEITEMNSKEFLQDEYNH
jgi:hypothetical protein